MTTSRKTPSRPRRKRETMDETLDRILAQPPGAPMKFTKPEAKAMLRRLFGREPEGPPGDEVVKRAFGLWPGIDDGNYPD